MRITRRLAAAAVVPFFALAACSGQDDANTEGAADGAGQTTGTGQTGGAGGETSAAAPAPTAKPEDVKFTKCEVEDGVAQVEATVTNSGDSTASIVVAVDIQQGGNRVDGVGLMANAVEAGKSVDASERGTKTDLDGDIECVASSVNAVAS